MGSKIGWGEFVIILVIALLVLGPDKLPQAGRALGKAVRSVKKYIHDATRELEEIDEFSDIKKDMEGIQKDLKTMGRSIEKSVADSAGTVEEDIKAVERELKDAVEKGPTETSAAEEKRETTAETPVQADEAENNHQEDHET